MDTRDETILVVEDDPDIRGALRMLLRLGGHFVATAENGAAALAWLRAHGEPCLVLLDLMMPVMDGWQLRRVMLEDPSLARVPVIIVSAVEDLDREKEALRAVAFLRKPLQVADLRRLVGEHCARA
jgi:CheY-like chemotaxis protein